MECDIHLFHCYNYTTFHFNSRTHVECDGIAFPHLSHTTYFNSRTHVECDPFPIRRSLSLRISTHALTWSATFRIQFQMFSDWISTHALTWSATLPFASFCAIMGISTHALTWSATIAQSLAQRPAVFQLTHSRGVRPAGCTDNGK